MTTFRVFFADRTTLDVDAKTPDEARRIARQRHDDIVLKVKVLKEKTDA